MAGGKCPDWLAVLSNRVLPPLFFFSLTFFLFHISGYFDGFLNFELGLAGVFAGAIALVTSLS